MNATDDWYDTKWLSDDTLMISEAGYQAYAVFGSDETVVIDTGIGVGDLRGLIESRTETPVRTLLTHWHWDHIGNAAQFERIAIHPRERTGDGRVAIDTLSKEFVDRPGAFISDWEEQGNELPEGVGPQTYAIEPAPEVDTIEPGNRIDLGDREIEIHTAYGHSLRQQAVLDRESGILFGGDVIGANGDVIAMFRNSDLESYEKTFSHLVSLRDRGEFDTLVTGHTRPYRGNDLTVLDDMYRGVRRVRSGTAPATHVETPWGPARRYEFDEFGVLTR